MRCWKCWDEATVKITFETLARSITVDGAVYDCPATKSTLLVCERCSKAYREPNPVATVYKPLLNHPSYHI